MLKKINGKSYRVNVGIAVMNIEGKFWVGRRTHNVDNTESFWQMPQGGLDKGETIEDTAIRELYEETGIKNIKILKTTDWMHYDYPPSVRKKRENDGQVQKWVLALFTGNEKEINLEIDNEFSEYKWENYKSVISDVVPFKKDVYKNLFKEFKDYLL